MNPDRPPRRRGWWIISILVVAVAGSIASLAYLKNARANRRIETERPILQKRTEDLRTRRDLRPVYFEPAAEGNGWPLLVKAVKGIAAVAQDELQAFPRLSNDEDAKVKPAEAEAVLIQIVPLLDDLKGALRRAWTEPDYDYENHLNMKSLNLGDVIKLSRVLAGAAVLRHDEGRYEESADLLILNLGLGDRVATKGNIIHVLVGIVVQNIAVSTLAQELLGQGRFDEPTLKRLQRVLDMAAKSRVSVLEAMRVEDLWQRHLAVDFATRGSAAIAGLGSPDALAGSWSIDGMSARYLETQDRFMTEIERLAWLPFPASQDGLKGLGKEIEKSSSPLHLLLVPQVARAFHNEKELEIEFALAKAAVAAARYRVKHKAWPKAWKDLVPEFLDAVPLDPMGSNSLGLVLKEGGIVIYSVGSDGVDDGGTRDFDENDLQLPGDFILEVKPAAK